MKKFLCVFVLMLMMCLTGTSYASDSEIIEQGARYAIGFGHQNPNFPPREQVRKPAPKNEKIRPPRIHLVNRFEVFDKETDEMVLSVGVRKIPPLREQVLQENVQLSFAIHRDDVKVDKENPVRFLLINKDAQTVAVPEVLAMTGKDYIRGIEHVAYHVPETFFDEAKKADQVILELSKIDGTTLQVVLTKAHVNRFVKLCHMEFEKVRQPHDRQFIPRLKRPKEI